MIKDKSFTKKRLTKLFKELVDKDDYEEDELKQIIVFF